MTDLNFCHNFAIFGKCLCEHMNNSFHDLKLDRLAKKRAYACLLKYGEPLYDLYNSEQHIDFEDALKLIKLSQILLIAYISINAHKEQKKCFEKCMELLRLLYYSDDLHLSKNERNNLRIQLVNTLHDYGKFIGNRLTIPFVDKLKKMNDIFDEAIKLDPLNGRLYYFYGTWLLRKQQCEKALPLLQQCILVNMKCGIPRVECYYHCSFCLKKLGKEKESNEMFKMGENLCIKKNGVSTTFDPLSNPLLNTIAFWIQRKRDELETNLSQKEFEWKEFEQQSPKQQQQKQHQSQQQNSTKDTNIIKMNRFDNPIPHGININTIPPLPATPPPPDAPVVPSAPVVSEKTRVNRKTKRVKCGVVNVENTDDRSQTYTVQTGHKTKHNYNKKGKMSAHAVDISQLQATMNTQSVKCNNTPKHAYEKNHVAVWKSRERDVTLMDENNENKNNNNNGSYNYNMSCNTNDENANTGNYNYNYNTTETNDENFNLNMNDNMHSYNNINDNINYNSERIRSMQNEYNYYNHCITSDDCPIFAIVGKCDGYQDITSISYCQFGNHDFNFKTALSHPLCNVATMIENFNIILQWLQIETSGLSSLSSKFSIVTDFEQVINYADLLDGIVDKINVLISSNLNDVNYVVYKKNFKNCCVSYNDLKRQIDKVNCNNLK